MTKSGVIKTGQVTTLLLAVGALAGCAGIDAATNHAALDVHTHMSETVFLDPVPAAQRTVYVGVRNTSDYPTLDVRTPLIAALEQRGYAVVPDPGGAHYMVQVNVLQAGKLPTDDAAKLTGAGYGQPLLAGAAAGSLTGLATNNGYAGLGVGIAALAATALINHAYQNVTYAVTTDIQISEKPLHGAKVAQYSHHHRGSGNYSQHAEIVDATDTSYAATGGSSNNSNERDQYVAETGDYKQYQVRDVAYANQVNLQMEQAIPELVTHLTSACANLFE